MDRRRPTFELSQLSWNQGNFEFPQSQIQRIKELIFVLERSKLEQEEEEDQTQTSGYSNMRERQPTFLWHMNGEEDTPSSFMMGKMELRKCEDVQKWRQDDTPPVGLHFLEDSRSTKQPEKKGKNK